MDENKSKAIADVCRKFLDQLAAEQKGILAALIASTDGFNLAAISSEISEERLAAMASSMHALGDQIASETKLKKCQDVLIEADMGKVLMVNIPNAKEDLILTVVANEAMTFGMLLYACRECAEKISTALAAGA